MIVTVIYHQNPMALFHSLPRGHAGEDGSHRRQGEGHARSDDQSGESGGGAQQSRCQRAGGGFGETESAHQAV